MSVGFTAVLTCSSAQESWQAVREIPLRGSSWKVMPHFLDTTGRAIFRLS